MFAFAPALGYLAQHEPDPKPESAPHTPQAGGHGEWLAPAGRDRRHDASLFAHYADDSAMTKANAAFERFQRDADRASKLTRVKQRFDECLTDSRMAADIFCHADSTIPFDRCMDTRKNGRAATQIESEITSASGAGSGGKEADTQKLKVGGKVLGIGAEVEGNHTSEGTTTRDGRSQSRSVTRQTLPAIEGFVAACEREAREEEHSK